MSFALAHQSKTNKIGEGKTSTPTKHSPPPSSHHHRINNLNSDDSPGSILYLQRAIGNQAVQRLTRTDRGTDLSKTGIIQPKLKVSQPGDAYEQEADKVAEQVMRISLSDDLVGPRMSPKEEGIDRKCAACKMKEEEEKVNVSRKAVSTATPTLEASNEITDEINDIRSSSGSSLDPDTKKFMEPRFGYDFSNIRIHADERSARSANSIRALAYTVGNNIVFGEGQYQPNTQDGRRILAHELTHAIQQSQTSSIFHGLAPYNSDVGNIASEKSSLMEGSRDGPLSGNKQDMSMHQMQDNCFIRNITSPLGQLSIQRTLGDGHDLTSPRFSRMLELEAAYDNETVIRKGDLGRGVQAIQHALYDLGYPLPDHGADGDFGRETEAAVKKFQRDHPPLAVDGEVGFRTVAALDAKFGAPVLPAPAARSAAWTVPCVLSILCPWSPHTIDVLRSRITLKSYDSISWTDEEWDGASWIPTIFPGGGYNTGTEIGVLNSSCEEMSETLYHEVLHAEQPRTHRTTLRRESYAYRIGEEFSIAMGLTGQPGLRSTDPRGREFADRAKVEAFVSSEYPSVPAGGGGDEIIGKAAAHGHVRVQRPDGSIYSRPAMIGERVSCDPTTTPGCETRVNEVIHDTSGWIC